MVKNGFLFFWALEKFFEKGGLEKNESLGDLGFIGLDPEKSCCVFQTAQ